MGEPVPDRLDIRFFPCPAVEEALEPLGTRESAERLPLARREHALADGFEVGQRSEALDVYTDLAPPGHGAESEARRVRHVEAHAAPIEGRRELRLAAWAVAEVNHAWIHAETLPEDRPQDRSPRHEANRVTVETEARRPLSLIVAE
jgi:hypothetical protein